MISYELSGKPASPMIKWSRLIRCSSSAQVLSLVDLHSFSLFLPMITSIHTMFFLHALWIVFDFCCKTRLKNALIVILLLQIRSKLISPSLQLHSKRAVSFMHIHEIIFSYQLCFCYEIDTKYLRMRLMRFRSMNYCWRWYWLRYGEEGVVLERQKSIQIFSSKGLAWQQGNART